MIHRIRWKRLAALALVAATLSPAASCAENIPTGAWKGVIGKAAIMVCFSGSDESQYYYLRHRRGIRLAPAEARNSQENSPEETAKFSQTGRLALDEFEPRENGEGEASGHWLLEAKSPTEITGTWTAPRDGKTLPITLHKAAPAPPIGSPDAGWGCDQAYYLPIVAGIRLTFHPAVVAGHSYRKVSSEKATSFEVSTDLPHAQALNRYAMEWLGSQSMLAFDCSASSRLSGFSGAEPIDRSLTPIQWTDHYLVLEDLLPEIYCGGAHGSSSLSYLTWSWSKGQMVDTWAWLQGGERSLVSYTTKDHRSIHSGLFRLIAGNYIRDEDGDGCRDVLDAMTVRAPYPSARGLVFNTSFFHAMRVCDSQVTLEWKQLAPYLSDEGRSLVNQFRR